MFVSLPASRLREPFHHDSETCPASPRKRLSRSLTYYRDSVTIGLSTRRPSHIPSHENVLKSRRCLVHNLHSSRSAVPFAVTFRESDPIIPVHTKAWVSDVCGVPSRSPLQKALNLSTHIGFPTNLHLDRWLLRFRQSSFHHRIQTLREHLGYPTSPHSAFTPSSCPFGAFPRRLGGGLRGITW